MSPFTRENYINAIKDALAYLKSQVELNNAINKYSINIEAETFYTGFLNVIYGFSLKNGNHTEKNIPSIDLYEEYQRDDGQRVAVQVTSNNNAKKIKKTLESFCTYGYQKDYTRLIILMITEKKNYRSVFAFPEDTGIQFDQNRDIVDVYDLLRDIEQINDTNHLLRIFEYLAKELPSWIIRIGDTEEHMQGKIELYERQFNIFENDRKNHHREDNAINNILGMVISEVIKCSVEAQNYLVWKHPEENFSTTSQLVVDPTHEALLVINGNAADLFGEGRHTLSTSNIPLLRKIIEIPTGGKTAFPCKVYFINKVQQMDLLWSTKDPIPLEDPLYDIFLHVMIHGSLSYSIVDSRKFLLKLVGLTDKFTPEMLVAKFRGIIAKHVKDLVSKIMINGQLSYFMISAHLLEISGVLQERIGEIFDEYGMEIEFFNVESISVPEKDYDAVSASKARRTCRLIEGYSWQEERQMMIAEKFASNEFTKGALGGTMGGDMGGMVMGNTISEVARNALSADCVPTTEQQKVVSGTAPTKGVNSLNGTFPFDVSRFLKNTTSSSEQSDNASALSSNGSQKFCAECGKTLSPGAKFCPECGHKVENNVCPRCGNTIKSEIKFCPECGYDLR